MKSFFSRARTGAAVLLLAIAPALSLPATAADPDLDVKVQIVGEEIRAQVSLFVRASRERVWNVITDFERAPEFTRDMQVSRVVSRSGDVLRLFQKTIVRVGVFAVPVETVREVRLSAPNRADSRLLGGSMKKYDSTTELVSEGGGTRLLFRSQVVPGSVFSGLVGEGTVKQQALDHFRELRAEILRREREHHAALKQP